MHAPRSQSMERLQVKIRYPDQTELLRDFRPLITELGGGAGSGAQLAGQHDGAGDGVKPGVAGTALPMKSYGYGRSSAGRADAVAASIFIRANQRGSPLTSREKADCPSGLPILVSV